MLEQPEQQEGIETATVGHSVSLSDILHQLLPEPVHEKEWLLQEGVVPGIGDDIHLVSTLSQTLHTVLSSSQGLRQEARVAWLCSLTVWHTQLCARLERFSQCM